MHARTCCANVAAAPHPQNDEKAFGNSPHAPVGLPPDVHISELRQFSGGSCGASSFHCARYAAILDMTVGSSAPAKTSRESWRGDWRRSNQALADSVEIEGASMAWLSDRIASPVTRPEPGSQSTQDMRGRPFAGRVIASEGRWRAPTMAPPTALARLADPMARRSRSSRGRPFRRGTPGWSRCAWTWRRRR